jgi:hypothetical protein
MSLTAELLAQLPLQLPGSGERESHASLDHEGRFEATQEGSEKII